MKNYKSYCLNIFIEKEKAKRETETETEAGDRLLPRNHYNWWLFLFTFYGMI